MDGASAQRMLAFRLRILYDSLPRNLWNAKQKGGAWHQTKTIGGVVKPGCNVNDLDVNSLLNDPTFDFCV